MDKIGSGKLAIVWLISCSLLVACGGGGGGAGSAGSVVFNNGSFDSGTGFDATVQTVALATDGSGDIYVGGFFTQYQGIARNRIVRLNNDGSLDAAFDPGTGFNASVLSIAPTTDGSGDIYVGGSFTTYDGISRARIARLNNDGSLDTGFDPLGGFNSLVRSIALAPDGTGDIYVGGSFASFDGVVRGRIARLTSSGTLNFSFNPGTGFNGARVETVIASDDGSGDIYAGGDFTAYRGEARAGIVRINSDGTHDAGFIQGSGFAPVGVSSLVLATDGSGDVYAGGAFATYNSVSRVRIARINSDGTLDPAFTVGSGFDERVLSIAPARDGSGDIYVGGIFSSFQGNSRNGVVRLNSDGSNDVGFNPGSGYDSSVTRVIPASDGSNELYVGGRFTTYRTVVINRINRLNSVADPD